MGWLPLGLCLSLAAASCSDVPAPSNSDLRQAVRAMEAGTELPAGVESEGERIRVEVHHEMADEGAVDLIESMGGIVEGSSPGIVQALVPYQRLADLEAHDEIRFLRPPLRVDLPETQSEGNNT